MPFCLTDQLIKKEDAFNVSAAGKDNSAALIFVRGGLCRKEHNRSGHSLHA